MGAASLGQFVVCSVADEIVDFSLYTENVKE